MTGIAMIIVGIVFLIIALYTFLVSIPKSKAQAARRTSETTGVISNVEEKIYQRKKSGKAGYYESKMYKLDFTYNADGTEYQIKGIASVAKHEQGEEFKVSYDPENPSDAHVNEFFAGAAGNKIGGVIFLIIAVVLILLGFLVKAI
ncbi:MAG: DUF3592 domain-containing protein [Lachnospiraceae bacterium]|nr:DUF3592 domain-containing protein [Lachnospiraceae bacterium]